MVKKIKLKAETIKDKNGTVAELRKDGMVPGILYGREVDNIKLKVKKHPLNVAYEEAGESSLVDIEIDGKDVRKVIIKDIQKDYLKDDIIHADFYQVDMKEKIEVEVPLNFINKSKAVEELDGILVKNLETLLIKSLPGDLVESIDVDLSALQTFDDVIRAGDVKIGENSELITSPNDSIVSVVERQEEVEEEPEEEAVPGEEKTEAGDEEKKEEKNEKKE